MNQALLNDSYEILILILLKKYEGTGSFLALDFYRNNESFIARKFPDLLCTHIIEGIIEIIEPIKNNTTCFHT